MFKISDENRVFLLKNFPELEVYFISGDLSELREQLDLIELRVGYDGSYEDGLNDFGRKIERINDDLHYDNLEK